MIPFNKPYVSAKEQEYLACALSSLRLSGDGPFTEKCTKILEKMLGSIVLLTTSCTHALDMSALLLNIKPGDEIIMPSFAFSSSANAFCLRGGIPVFVDIRDDTQNIDENLIEEKITPKTKAICVVHYAGVGCEMDKIMKIANKYNLPVIEDAAQALGSKYKGRPLGTFGTLGTLSFHETKNTICGEGGALIINDKSLLERAEIIREKGTNRSKFIRGEIDKYTWIDVGSSYLPSDILASLLFAQLEQFDEIQTMRKKIFEHYYKNLGGIGLQLPYVPSDCEQNYHMFYIILESHEKRIKLMDYLKANKICSVFHFIPLHSSIMGKKFGVFHLPKTDMVSRRILRLPFFPELTISDQDNVILHIKKFLT